MSERMVLVSWEVYQTLQKRGRTKEENQPLLEGKGLEKENQISDSAKDPTTPSVSLPQPSRRIQEEVVTTRLNSETPGQLYLNPRDI